MKTISLDSPAAAALREWLEANCKLGDEVEVPEELK